MDGTLTDSKEGIFLSLRYALNFFGIEEKDDEKLKLFLGPPLVGAFMKYYGLSEEQALLALEKYREIFAKEGIYRLSVYPGITSMLQTLKKEKMIILATSKPILYAKEIMERTGLSYYFDYLEGATMDESRTEKSDVIRYTIDKYNLNK